ncbi:ATP-grasp domain-containing protein [Pseudomonas sp.]|uniref:ATP-grasp domain-containing protein n=1 Tax=Pseudomonas sp. TaxID=306 RepID=UPI003C71C87A
MNLTDQNKQVSWAIVDGYSSGKHFARLLNEKGISVYHIQSMSEILEYDLKSFDASQYKANFAYSGDYGTLLEEIRSIENLTVILPGCETGVALADLLSEDLGTPTNGRFKSESRRNKFDMAESLSIEGVRSAKTFRVESEVELERAAEQLGLPAVVKPCASAGSDDVYICKTKDELFKAFQKIHRKTNTLGLVNDAVLVQQLLIGKQYIVNTISYGGQHFIAEIWEDNREDVGTAYIYNYERLLLSHGPLEQALVDYTKSVLDALAVRNGPCHVELMVNNGVPTLIEVGARPAGGIQHQVMSEAQGYSHVSATIDCYLEHGLTQEYLNKKSAKHVLSVSLISRRSGILKGYNNLDKVEGLSSFQCLVGLPNIGSQVQITRDLETSPGILMLSHESEQQVLGDLDTFRSLELNGMFDLGE